MKIAVILIFLLTAGCKKGPSVCHDDKEVGDKSVGSLYFPGKDVYYNFTNAKSLRRGYLKFPTLKFPAFKIPEAITWDENPYQNISWEYQYHSMMWLYGTAFDADHGSPGALEKMKTIVLAYLDRHGDNQCLRTNAWYDHAVANRATVMSYLYSKYLSPTLSEIERAKYISSMQALGECLRSLLDNPRFKGHNHSMVHAMALITVSKTFGMSQGDWVCRSKGRIYELMDEMVGEDGVTREQSMAYHYTALRLFLTAVNFGKSVGYEIPDKYLKKIEKMIEFSGIMLAPDGSIPALGDSEVGYKPSVAEPNGSLKAFLKFNNDPVALFVETKGKRGRQPNRAYYYPESGYAVVRPSYSREKWMDDFYAFADMGSMKGGHGHYDSLSFVLYAFGTTLLSDSGGPYNYSSSERFSYFIHPKAHNLVVVDGLNFSKSRPKATGFLSENGYTWLQATNEINGDSTHRRDIVFFDNGKTFVLDRLASRGVFGKTFDLLYHFPDKTDLTEKDGHFVSKTRGKAGLVVKIFGKHKVNPVRKFGAEDRAFQSWETSDYNSKVPTYLLRTTVKAKKTWLLTVLEPYREVQPHPMDVEVSEAGYDLKVKIVSGGEIIFHRTRPEILVPSTQVAK